MATDAERLLASLGRRIGELREQAGLTQAEVADRVKMTVSNYQRIEHGLQNATVLTLARISTAIGVEVGTLFTTPITKMRRRGRPPRSATRR